MNRSLLKNISKRVAIIGLCAVSAVNMVMSAIPLAEAKGSKSTLGTNTALGSPILNQTNFSTEDWNEWETICWGVFLSNFCQPFIDNYNSTFNTGNGGSNGHGYDALWGGSGSDQANKAVVRALTDYAIEKQVEINEEIYVAYTPIEGGKPGEKKDEGDITEADLRPATFRDLFFQGFDVEEPEKHTYAKYYERNGNDVELSHFESEKDFSGEYDDLAVVEAGSLPTFYVHRPVGETVTGYTHHEYIEILDYTDWWDVQIMSWLSNAIRNNDDLSAGNIVANTDDVLDVPDAVAEGGVMQALQSLWEQDPPLTFDTFGNVVTKYDNEDGRMVLPACLNQHITGEACVNILNSWIINNYVNTYEEEQMLFELRQNLDNVGTEWLKAGEIMNGLPAFGKSGIGNIGLFYYDLDSVMARAVINGDTDIKYGNMLLELYNQDINNSLTNFRYPLKFEVAGNSAIVKSALKANEDVKNVLTNTAYCASMLPNVLFKDLGEEGQKTILSQILTPKGDKLSLFTTEATAIPVRVKDTNSTIQKTTGKNGLNNDRGAGALRLFFNWMYKKYNNTNQNSSTNSWTITSALEGKKFNEFRESLGDPSKSGVGQGLYDKFCDDYSEYKFAEKDQKDLFFFGDPHRKDVGTGSNAGSAVAFDAGNNETFCDDTSRVVLAYRTTDIMREASKFLGIKDGAEFDTYCTYIYMTYLDFYGVNSSATIATGVHNSSKFDSLIYNTNLRRSVLIEDIAKELYEKDTDFTYTIDVEEEVLQMSYLMLNPENGREYRRNLTNTVLTDFMYEQYNRIVFGGSSNYSGTTSKARSGFLAIETYADNFLTSAFLENYVTIAVYLILFSILGIILYGLLKKRRVSWFFVSGIIAINSFLLAPTSGEIVPYLTSAATTRMFFDKMTFWSISQGITNATLERNVVKQSGEYADMSNTDAEVLMSLVNDLSTIQTDSSLCVKQDISQKVTQKLEGIYKNIESYQSAKWILPMVIQQFSANMEKNMENFIYKPVNNIWVDLSNIYWYYNPLDADHTENQSSTATSGQITSNMAKRVGEADGKPDINTDLYVYENLNSIFPDAVKITGNSVQDSTGQYWNYRCYSHSLNNAGTQVHLSIPYLNDTTRVPISRKGVFGNNADSYEDVDSWQAYIDKSVSGSGGLKVDNWKTYIDSPTDGQLRFENTADSYDRYDRNTITPDMPYLLNTESPIYYFYAVVKDSIHSSDTLGTLVNSIQGSAKLDDGTGDYVRNSFMFATKSSVANAEMVQSSATSSQNADNATLTATGYTRDILDLEEMFTNTIPYLYQMSITACGFDGVSGILGDEKITNELQYYEGENMSWMYRCNWATKIMENPSFSKPTTVRDSSGATHTVKNPLLTECYPANRPMVFSDAQREALGLKNSDLNLVELKCIDLNKRVERSWTLLLNYVGTSGLTKEVLIRQMATDATLLFSSEFSSSGILDTKYELYPQSLDLRYLSFDAIMKMLMLNSSKNTNFIYGDSMLTVLSDSDMFTGALLLVDAFICAFLIPLARTILMAVIFYLGFLAIFRTLLADEKTKFNVTCGQLISNLCFMGYTIFYYFLFYILMRLTNTTEVLSAHKVSTNAGSPVWVIIITILFSVAYVFILIKHIKFCFEHSSDMGYSAFTQMASNIVGAINGLAEKGLGSITNYFSGGGSNHNSTSNTSSIKGTGISGNGGVSDEATLSNSSVEVAVEVTVKDGNGTVVKASMRNNQENSSENYDSNYSVDMMFENGAFGNEATTANDINNMIDEGNEVVDHNAVNSYGDIDDF